MKGVKLENERLLIQVNEQGSELARIYDKKEQREVLWDASPEIWPRYAPILFPFIGNCYEGQYRYNDQVYPMTPHGFARDMNFDLDTLSEDEVWFALNDTEETEWVYPFQFTLSAGHRLEENRIHVLWKLKNRGNREMLYMLGGHPAFRAPKGKTIYDFTFRFDQQDSLHYEAPNQLGYTDPAKSGILLLDEGKAALTKGFFEKPLTYIFDRAQVGSVSLLLPGEEPYVTLECQGIPYLGVWTMEATHPFVCLEPWFGRCADDGFEGELKERAGVMSLAPGETFEAEYTIVIH